MAIEFERAMNALEVLYKERISSVQSDLLHIQMELDRLKWTFSFVKQQEQELRPIHYFQL
jgi:hypothetical protein